MEKTQPKHDVTALNVYHDLDTEGDYHVESESGDYTYPVFGFNVETQRLAVCLYKLVWEDYENNPEMRAYAGNERGDPDVGELAGWLHSDGTFETCD